MGRTADYSKEICSVAGALSVVGDPWTLIILRDAFAGVRRFDEWQSRLGVARNVLAARLKSLVAFGVMETRLYSERPPRHEYILTRKGQDLLPVLLTLKAWGDRYVYGACGAPAVLKHSCGADLEPRLVCDACGETLHGRDIKGAERNDAAPPLGEVLAGEALAGEAAE
ncbi:winged helix-turn-helix transcriptional regulator [Caulobacter sp. KR2-114]|uniref:winged helix-turn-helix transcriptional regulator n=1 Tax=Caulobacter sp. KR2-114 TaxID=3400912 RepID=UPI003C0AB055